MSSAGSRVTSTSLNSIRALLAVGVFLALLSVAGCRSGISGAESEPDPALNDRFVADTVAGGRRTRGGGSFTPHFKVVRNGVARDAMVLEAPVAIRLALGRESRGAVLECLSTPVFNVGDGLQLEVLLAQNGRQRLIFSRYYDAGRRLDDRAWIPLTIPLDVEAPSGDAELELRVSGGPQGDLVADWLALSAARMVQNSRKQ